MITIGLRATLAETRGSIVELRTDIDGWAERPVAAERYDPAAGTWIFLLDPTRYGTGFRFKFFLQPDSWQRGDDLRLTADQAVDGTSFTFDIATLEFDMPGRTGPAIDLGLAGLRLFDERADPSRLYDVIVIGSGMAGGTLTDFLSDIDSNHPDADLQVLLLEAGGLLFPTHIGNLPRRQRPGEFTKHLWELWGQFSTRNYENLPGSDYVGGQAFALGGRSLFWGGFIPRMSSFELDRWPRALKWYLEDIGYLVAEEFMGRSAGARTFYDRQIHLLLRRLFPNMNHVDAPVAVRQAPEGANTVAPGVFSTADVVTESWLTGSPGGRQGLSVLLNHEAVAIDPSEPTVRVTACDLKADRLVTFRARTVVLAAGCLESARLAKRSRLPGGDLIGRGVSDHPIFFTHFSIPRASPYFDPFGNVKTMSQPKEGADRATRPPFNMLLELGADLNQGRYLDESILEDHLAARKDKMLCEVVFLCDESLNEENRVTFSDDALARPSVLIKRFQRPDLRAQAEALKWRLLRALGAQPVVGDSVDPAVDEAAWKAAFGRGGHDGDGMPGGVAHEVGSLRMRVVDANAAPVGEGIVDEDLRYLGLPHDNVYVCDLSVFPTTPAANPSLTVVALAIRLAEHLRRRLAVDVPVG